MASLARGTQQSDHMHAICQCDVRRVWDYNFGQSAKSCLPIRVVWEEHPQALRIDSICPTSFWLHLLFPLSLLTLSLADSHPALYSSIPLLIHPFHPLLLPYILSSSFSLKLLHYTTREHPLAPFCLLLRLLLFFSSPSRYWLRQCYFRLYSC